MNYTTTEKEFLAVIFIEILSLPTRV